MKCPINGQKKNVRRGEIWSSNVKANPLIHTDFPLARHKL